MNGRQSAILAAMFLIWGAACGVTSTPGSSSPPEATSPSTTLPSTGSDDQDSPTTSSTPVSTTSPMSEVPQDLLAAILAAAAEQTGQATGTLRVVKAEFVEWPDGSLGCPEPGMLHTQAIVPGYWIQIEAGDQLLDYRADSSGGFRLCTT